jgi:hypothetical protein
MECPGAAVLAAAMRGEAFRCSDSSNNSFFLGGGEIALWLSCSANDGGLGPSPSLVASGLACAGSGSGFGTATSVVAVRFFKDSDESVDLSDEHGWVVIPLSRSCSISFVLEDEDPFLLSPSPACDVDASSLERDIVAAAAAARFAGPAERVEFGRQLLGAAVHDEERDFAIASSRIIASPPDAQQWQGESEDELAADLGRLQLSAPTAATPARSAVGLLFRGARQRARAAAEAIAAAACHAPARTPLALPLLSMLDSISAGGEVGRGTAELFLMDLFAVLLQSGSSVAAPRVRRVLLFEDVHLLAVDDHSDRFRMVLAFLRELQDNSGPRSAFVVASTSQDKDAAGFLCRLGRPGPVVAAPLAGGSGGAPLLELSAHALPGSSEALPPAAVALRFFLLRSLLARAQQDSSALPFSAAELREIATAASVVLSVGGSITQQIQDGDGDAAHDAESEAELVVRRALATPGWRDRGLGQELCRQADRRRRERDEAAVAVVAVSSERRASAFVATPVPAALSAEVVVGVPAALLQSIRLFLLFPFLHPQLFLKFFLRKSLPASDRGRLFCRGVLIADQPGAGRTGGTGKTALAHAIASVLCGSATVAGATRAAHADSDAPVQRPLLRGSLLSLLPAPGAPTLLGGFSFISVSCADLVAPIVGQTEKNIAAAFAAAATAAPCVLLLDNIDAIAAPRGLGGGDTSSERTMDRLLSLLLVLLDGVASATEEEEDSFARAVSAPRPAGEPALQEQELLGRALRSYVLVVGTCRRISDVDPALRRPGRLELHLTLPGVPQREDLAAMLHSYFRRMPIDFSEGLGAPSLHDSCDPQVKEDATEELRAAVADEVAQQALQRWRRQRRGSSSGGGDEDDEGEDEEEKDDREEIDDDADEEDRRDDGLRAPGPAWARAHCASAAADAIRALLATRPTAETMSLARLPWTQLLQSLSYD